MAAIRRAPKGTSGGHGTGPKSPGVERFIVHGPIRLQRANDNPPKHGSLEALCVAEGIVLTLGAWVLVLQAVW